MNFAYQVNIDFRKCYKNTCDMKIFQTAMKMPDKSIMTNATVYACGLFCAFARSKFVRHRSCVCKNGQWQLA